MGIEEKLTMKLLSPFLFSLVSSQSPGVRKVPPRTPPQRLDTLCRFSEEYLNNRVAMNESPMDLNRPSRAAVMSESIERLCSNMLAAFEKQRPDGSGLRRCSFFDPNVKPHGGPRPEEDRNRRNQWIDKWMDELDQGNWLVGYNGDDRRRRETSEFVDPFDEYEMDWQRGVDTQIRLSNDLNIAWKQIAVAYRKWVVRYLSECSGQQEHQYHTRRLVKIARNLNDLVYQEQGEIMINFDERLWREVDGDDST